VIAQGEALVQRPADIAWVQIGVEARGGRPEEARDRAASSIAAVLAALKPSVANDARRTEAYSVVTEMDYSTSGSRLTGYLARNRIEVRVDDLNILSTVMDAGVISGATSVSGLRFDIKGRAEVEREALRLAVEDAVARARTMAAGAGQRLGRIVRIQEQRVSRPIVASEVRAGAGRGGVTPVPVEPGVIDIRTVTFVTVAIE
jgi:uncharacterized protein YggE